MPGGNRVGRVYYDVDAENNVSKGLAAAEGEAQAFTQRVNAMDAHIEVDADLSELKKDLAEAKALKEAMEGEWKDLDLDIPIKQADIKRMKEAGMETRKANGELAAMETRYNRLGHAIQRNAAQQKLYNSLITSRKDELRLIDRVIKSEKQHAKAIDDTTDRTKQQAFEIAKLEQKYIKLHDARRRADKGIRGIHSRADKARLNAIDTETALIRERLIHLGKTEDHMRSLDTSLDRNSERWTRWGQSIAGTRVHLGFISTTMSGLLRLMVAFGPVVLSVLASLGSLISVAGAGIMGAFAAGGAALTGFGLAAVGVGIALREPIHQLGVAWKASTAYSDAVQKYGKNSSQAQDKQEQLNNAIKGLPPQAQKAVKQLGGMRQEFMKMGGDQIRGDFFDSFAQGIKTASALLPTFAKGSAQVFHQVSQGFNQWMQGLRSAEAQNIMADIFKGTADFVPGLMAGLGNLASAFGRIAQAASHFLGGLGDGFQKWTQGIEDSVGAGDQLQARVGRWIESMRKVGHFTQAAASALTTFFGIGVGPGGGFLDSMTRSLQRWNKEMQANPESVREFFTQGIGLMEQLGPAVGRALMTLAHAAQVLSPAIEAAATVFNQLFDVAASLPTWFWQAAGGAYALSKALRLLTGIRLAGVLAGLLSGGGAAAGGGILARILGGAAGTAGGAAATRQLALFGAEMGALPLLLNPYTAAALAAGVGTYFLVKAISSGKTNAEQGAEAMQGFAQANRAIPQAMKANVAAQNKAGSALAQYNKLVKQGKGDSKAATQLLRQHARAQEQAVQAQQQQQFETEKQHDKMVDLTDAYNDQKEQLENLQQTYGKGSPETKQAAKDFAQVGAQLRLATLNYHRLQAGAQAATPAMLRSLQTIKGIAGRKTALKFRFDDEAITGGISRLSSKLTGLGQKSRVIKILANSKSAEQAYGRLIKLDHQVKNKKISVSADDAASNVIAPIKSKIDSLKDKLVHMKANDAASGKIAAIQAKIQALRDRVVTITTQYKTVGAPPGVHGPVRFMGGPAPQVSGYARGGVPADSQANWVTRMMDRAYARADQRAGIRSDSGARVTNPRYVVGEQAPKYNEFIITENPSYRQSNLRYLQMAAESLGRQLVPGYGGGGHHKKKGGGKGPVAQARGRSAKAGKRLPGVQSAGHDYTMWSDEVDYWAEELDLDRNAYDNNLAQAGNESYAKAGRTGLLGEMLGDIDKQIFAYGMMKGLNEQLKDQKPIPEVKGKVKKDKKQKKIDKANERIAAFNDALSEARDQQMSNRDIDHAISALNQEALQMENAAATNTLLGTSETNRLSYETMRSFASNITGAITVPSLGGGGLASATTMPPLGGSGGASAATAASQAAVPMAAGAGITINNTFTEPPPDPHTFTTGVAFELSALSS